MKKVMTLIVISLLSACGSSDTMDDMNKKMGIPNWALKGDRIYKDAKTGTVIVEGVGTAQGIKNVALARETADSRGRANVATKFGTIITRLREDYQKSVSDLTNEPVEEQLVRVTGKEFTTQMLVGCEVIDRFYDEKNNVWYSRCKLDMSMSSLADNFKNQVKPVVAQRIKTNADEALKRLDSTVDNYLKNGIPTESSD